MLRGTANVSCVQIRASCNVMSSAAFLGARCFFSSAYITNPGSPSVKGISNRLEAVYKTALLAQFLLTPIISSVDGSLIAMPDLISGCLINQLFAKPPPAQATVLTIPLRTKSLPPLALAVTSLAMYRTVAPALQLANTAIT